MSGPDLSCNCESLACGHGEKSCAAPGVTGKFRLQDLGAVCEPCYKTVPEQYRIPPAPEAGEAVTLTYNPANKAPDLDFARQCYENLPFADALRDNMTDLGRTDAQTDEHIDDYEKGCEIIQAALRGLGEDV